MATHYEVLNVAENATIEQIKLRFQQLILLVCRLLDCLRWQTDDSEYSTTQIRMTVFKTTLKHSAFFKLGMS